jgi:hypothetical protein
VNVAILPGERVLRRAAVALLVLFISSACDRDADEPERPKGAQQRLRNSNGGALDLRSDGYSVSPVANPGALVGTVKLDGEPPATPDSISAAFKESGCPASRAKRDTQSTATGLSNAVVWIADVESGKALPTERRLDLASQECELEPRVQAAVIGSTFNVFNDDRMLHRLVFIRFGTKDTLTVTPFFNSGSVVPSQRLAKSAGLVEVRCAQHSWTHAYIAVFDHPYFAVTKPDGTFRIDSMPPGSYRMMVWHQGAAQPVERTVSVTAGGEAKVDVGIALTQ